MLELGEGVFDRATEPGACLVDARLMRGEVASTVPLVGLGGFASTFVGLILQSGFEILSRTRRGKGFSEVAPVRRRRYNVPFSDRFGGRDSHGSHLTRGTGRPIDKRTFLNRSWSVRVAQDPWEGDPPVVRA